MNTDADAALAAIIASPNPPQDWLLKAIAKARQTLSWTLEKERTYPGRPALRERLQKLAEAIREVRNAIRDFDVQQILLGEDDFFLNQNDMYHGLLDLEKRTEARLAPIRSGKGRDKFYTRPEGATPEQNCALMVSVLWNRVHGKQPPNTNDGAQRACGALWAAAGGGTCGRWGATQDKVSVVVWRDHLRTAKVSAGSPEARFIERSLGATEGGE